MNLLFDPWIPVTRRSGARGRISPLALAETDDPPVSLNAVRHDFDAALAQFLIGLLQSFLPPRTDSEWSQRLKAPPGKAQLSDVFERYRHAFELFDPERPFLQDVSLSGSIAEADPVSALLIDAPGGNTIKENKDIFSKRDRVLALAPDVAAQALLSLQINAPGGGVGYRTGLRGGGPLTTIIWPSRGSNANAVVPTLWQKVWLNVLKVDWQDSDVDWTIALPWLGPVRTSRKGDRDEIIMRGALKQGHGADPLCYWATPRRVRLLCADQPVVCDLCGETANRPVVGVLADNYGPNYASNYFLHPLSPYYRAKAEEVQWLPLHPRGGGIGFRDWPTLCAVQNDSAGARRPAANVAALQERTRQLALRSLALDHRALWAFGYELENAKVLTWQESTLPIYPECEEPAVLGILAGKLVAAAELARSLLRGALKGVFGTADGSLPDSAERTLFDAAEPGFYQALSTYSTLSSGDERVAASRALREQWARSMRAVLMRTYDSVVDAADVLADTRFRHLELAAKERARLSGSWRKEHFKVLDLPLPDEADAAAAKPRKTRSPA